MQLNLQTTFQMLAGGLIFLAAAQAHAQNPPHFQITIAPGTPAAKTIVDGDENDMDPKQDAIGYNANIVINGVPCLISIHAIQNVVGPGTGGTVGNGKVEVRIDDLTLRNSALSGQPSALTSSIVVVSGPFAAIGGPAQPFSGRVHLDGKYASRGKIFQEKVALSGFVLQSAPAPNLLIGTVDIPGVQNQTPSVAFGPKARPKDLDNGPFSVGPTPDVTQQFKVGVTQLSMELNFTLNGSNDTIRLPGSAVVSGYAVDHIFTVNSAADIPDGVHPPGSQVCDTGNVNLGTFPTNICTLRAALTETNFINPPATSAIQFNIPGVPRIVVDTTVSHNEGNMNAATNVIIDGTTQPGAMVELNGSHASPTDFGGDTIVGLNLNGENSTVLGMVINGFLSHAIQLRPTSGPVGNNVIQENSIGTDTTGQVAIPNGGDGIHVLQMPNNSIRDNIIAHNTGQGVSVDGFGATGNRIHANPISANGGGISLTNGGNNLQNPPNISSATEDGSDLTIAGTAQSTPNSIITLDFFANAVCDREGADFLGSAQAATDASGIAIFTAILSANISEGTIATATATDALGNTSQFSACATIREITPTTQPPVANAGPNQTASTGTLVLLSGNGSFDPNTPPLALTFLWTQTAGPTVALTGANTATPSFTPAQPGIYVFSLVANNGVADSAAASVTITVVTPALAVQVTSSGFLYSRATRTFYGTVTVTNIGGSATPDPLHVGFAGLPATVTLVNATTVVGGVPFITLSGSLAPGQSASFTVQFSNPSNVNIHYSSIVN
jgi:hypothetical protein